MGILFTTGTINQPDAGSVGLAMAEKIRDDLMAHAAWDLVEEFTPASGLVRWYVFTCLAAQSGLSSDFYFIMGRTLSSGELRTFICEGYNPATHVASLYASSSGTSTYAYDGSGRTPSTYTLGAAVLSIAAANPKYTAWIPGGTSTKWWIAAADDGFTVAFNGPANGFIHCGAYTPLTALPIALPIQMISNDADTGMITRNPAVAGISAIGNALWIQGGGGAGPSGQAIVHPVLGFQGRLAYNDKLQSDQRPVAELGININQNNIGDSVLYGWALGKQKRMRIGTLAAPAGIAFGDAYALQGRLWVPYLPTDFRMWDTGVAA